MAFMAAAIPYITAATAAVSAIKTDQNQKAAAEQTRIIGAHEAAQLERNANSQRAAAQRRAEDIKRQVAFITSRARAVAGSSGAGVSDPSVVNTIADLTSEGEYRAMTALYNGEEAAKGMESQAAATRMGASSRADSYSNAGDAALAEGLMKSGSILYDKYNTQPKTTTQPKVG